MFSLNDSSSGDRVHHRMKIYMLCDKTAHAEHTLSSKLTSSRTALSSFKSEYFSEKSGGNLMLFLFLLQSNYSEVLLVCDFLRTRKNLLFSSQ